MTTLTASDNNVAPTAGDARYTAQHDQTLSIDVTAGLLSHAADADERKRGRARLFFTMFSLPLRQSRCRLQIGLGINVPVPFSFLFFVVFLGVNVPKANTAEYAEFPFDLGFLDKGKVFSGAEFIENTSLGLRCVFQLWSTPLQPAKIRSAGTTKYHIVHNAGERMPMHWRIKDSCVWSLIEAEPSSPKGVQRIPVDDLHFFDPMDPQGWNKFRVKYKKDATWWLSPVERLQEKQVKVREYGNPVFDFLPTSANTGLLFLFQYKRLRVWQAEGSLNEGKSKNARDELWNIKFTERENLGFAFDLREPFQAFGNAETWYFMTLSGKLYVCHKPAEKQKRKLELLYAEIDSPIEALINDVATNRTFAFTVPNDPMSGKGKRVYFELAPKLQPKPYEAKPLTGIKIDCRVKMIWEYAQVLIADGRVKLPAEK